MKKLNNAICMKLLSIIIIILLLQSCETDHTGGGCPKYATNYHTLSTSAISQTPYFTNKAFDTISYASNKGDTLTFVKTKTDTTWYCEDDNSNPNCPKEKANCYQVLHNTYTTIKGNGSFDVKLSYKTKNNGLYLLDITFNERLFGGISNDAIGIKSSTDYFDDLIINGKSYKKVIKLGYINCNIFLNNSYGLFKFEYFNNNINWIYYK